jgi:hypothetical protein
MKNCSNCEHSYPVSYIDDSLDWTEEDQKNLDEEKERNKRVERENNRRWFTSAQFGTYGYIMKYERYARYKELQETTIECRWGPNFAERLKTDKCSQWKAVVRDMNDK